MAEPSKPPFRIVIDFLSSAVNGPVDFAREKIVLPLRGDKRYYYYHRRYRRVPTIDECEVDDGICFFEANEQFIRDREVENKILALLRRRRLECETYYQNPKDKRCEKLQKEYVEAEENWFTKYGDLGFRADVREAYMKQKHRMIWERRHGPVGTGMKSSPPK